VKSDDGARQHDGPDTHRRTKVRFEIAELPLAFEELAEVPKLSGIVVETECKRRPADHLLPAQAAHGERRGIQSDIGRSPQT